MENYGICVRTYIVMYTIYCLVSVVHIHFGDGFHQWMVTTCLHSTYIMHKYIMHTYEVDIT